MFSVGDLVAGAPWFFRWWCRLAMAAVLFFAGLFSAAAGTLEAEAVGAYAGYFPYKMLARDVNGDGGQDLIILDRYSLSAGNLQIKTHFNVLLNDGSGNFSTAQRFSLQTLARGYSLASGDFNNDGNLDVAVSSGYLQSIQGTFDAAVTVFLGDGSGGFLVSTVYTSATHPDYDIFSVSSGDLNGDGIDDIAAFASKGGSAILTFLISDGSGSFTPTSAS